MKNTKNVLMAGIVLAMTLFASVQVVAMERKVNPYLTENQKWEIEGAINAREHEAQSFDPKKTIYVSDNMRNYLSAVNTAELKAYKSIYYGNKAYTAKEIQKTVNSYTKQVKPEAFGLE